MVRLPRSQHVVGRNTPLWSPFTLTWSDGFGRSIRIRIYMYIHTCTRDEIMMPLMVPTLQPSSALSRFFYERCST